MLNDYKILTSNVIFIYYIIIFCYIIFFYIYIYKKKRNPKPVDLEILYVFCRFCGPEETP